ncbi:MAG: MFS transporter [Patescibacteria group bacterium]|nr:MFS transporter [Patescibacteria group bacterium]
MSANGFAMGLTSTAYVPYLTSVGVTLPQVALINAVFFLTIVLAELPTGMLADGRGRAWSVRIGAVVYTLSHLALAFANGLWSALVCEIMMGVAFAFLSGAELAWVTDALSKQGESHRLRKVLATSAICMSMTCLCGGVIGAFIGAHSLRAAILASVIGGIGMIVVTCCFMNGDGEPVERVTEFDALHKSVTVLKQGNGLVWAMVVACSLGLVLSFNHYWAPFFAARTGHSGLSYVWLIIIGGSMLGAYLARRDGWTNASESTGVLIALMMTAVGMVFTGLFSGIVAPLMLAFMHEVGRGLFRPLLDTYVQRRVESSYRATFGSLQSFVSRLGFSVILVCVWLLSSGHEENLTLIAVTWFVNGTLMVLISALLWIFRPKRS